MSVNDPVSILAVDDNASNLLALEAIFANRGIKVVRARSGEEALMLLSEQEFAVILMDAHMPFMDGFETARLIRQSEGSGETPIIFVTATHKDTLHAATGYDVGAVDYIFKPLVPEVLRAKVAVFVELFKKNQQLKAVNAQLQEMTKAAGQARDQAIAASRFKSEFLANMSHEIRTPMNGVLGMIEILLKSGLTEKQKQYATTAREAGKSLLAVIDDILDFSKIEAGKLTLEVVDLEVVRLVEGVAELLSAQAKQSGLSLLTFIDPELPHLMRGDPWRIRQILINFVGNAIKFSEQGSIMIRATAEALTGKTVTVKFVVTDPGIGMTNEEISRLFEPFSQADGSNTRKFGGTGLGLSICKRLVELMGGKIGVSSVKGEGSSFWFCIPLEIASESAQRAPGIDLSNLKVLIVDDDPIAAEIETTYVSAWGMQTASVGSVKDALPDLSSALSGKPYDLVVVDLVMPEVDGLELARIIREDPQYDKTKLILVTAFDKPGIGEEAIQRGFDAYLTKPIRQSQLLNAIVTLFHEPSTESKAADTAAPIVAAPRTEIILVAEDHPINQQVALLLLKDLGFEAHIAANGREVIELSKRLPYSLIFMDCQMPELDGFEATRELRKLETMTGKHVPIVAMTAHAIEGSREQCLAAGMDDYISKPIDPNNLNEIINKWLPLKGPSESGNGQLDAYVNVGELHSKFGATNAKNLLLMFARQAPSDLSKLKLAVEERNAKNALQVSHGLIGVLGSISAFRLREQVRELEEELRAEDWDAVQLRVADFEKLVSEFVGLMQSV